MAARSVTTGPGGLTAPSYVDITLAASATTDGIEATFTVKDCKGNAYLGVCLLDIWISESATGQGLTADSASGALTAVTGTILTAITAKKQVSMVTDVNGVATLKLVDSANPADQYFCCANPGGGITVSAASGTSWEGA